MTTSEPQPLPGETDATQPAREAELQRALDEEGERFDALVARMPTRRYGPARETGWATMRACA